MKIKIFKKLLAVLCAATMSMSAISSVGAADDHVGTVKLDQNQEINQIIFHPSFHQKWWDDAKLEIDDLIAKAAVDIYQKNINLNNLYKKYEQLFAGLQSYGNCWLFSSQNVANYFLDLDKQTPIRKTEPDVNNSRYRVEQEFLKRQPGKSSLLYNGQDQFVMREYLNTYGVNAQDVSIVNYELNNNEHRQLMNEFAYFLLIQHFGKSDIPVIVNVGNHWITIAGIDVKTKKALVLDPLDSTPAIVDLDFVVSYISNVQYLDTYVGQVVNRITMIFPSKCAKNDSIFTFDSKMNWNVFKSKILNLPNK